MTFTESFDTDFPTKGPTNRISAVLFIEKEGFNELFKAVKLAERYDLAIMSSKGQSLSRRARLVDDAMPRADVPLLVLHDFDKAGLEIAQNLTAVSEAARESDRVRYEFANDINVIDLGIRLTDVRSGDSRRSRFVSRVTSGPDSIATPEEQEFLRSNRRVELERVHVRGLHQVDRGETQGARHQEGDSRRRYAGDGLSAGVPHRLHQPSRR